MSLFKGLQLPRGQNSAWLSSGLPVVPLVLRLAKLVDSGVVASVGLGFRVGFVLVWVLVGVEDSKADN